MVCLSHSSCGMPGLAPLIITDSVVLWKIQKFDWLIPETKWHSCLHSRALFSYLEQGRIQNLLCRGAQVTNEAEGFTEARSAERGRLGRGSPPPAGGVRGSPPENFEKFASKWCILSAFWGNQCTFLTMKLHMKKRKKKKEMRFTVCIYKLIILFFSKFWEIHIKMVHFERILKY